MTATNRFRLVLVFCLALPGMPARLEAQFGPLTSPGQAAQARSQDEFDSYLEIVSATDASVVVQKVKTFVSTFPKSELLGAAYQYQLQAFEQLNDFDGMLAAGEKALTADPDTMNTLLALAPAMANRAAARPDRIQLLSQAEAYAHRALDGIDKIKIPRELSIEQWNIRKHEMQSDAHGVIGVVAFQRGQFPLQQLAQGRAAVGAGHAEILFAEVVDQQLPLRRLVLNHNNMRAMIHAAESPVPTMFLGYPAERPLPVVVATVSTGGQNAIPMDVPVSIDENLPKTIPDPAKSPIIRAWIVQCRFPSCRAMIWAMARTPPRFVPGRGLRSPAVPACRRFATTR